MKNYVQVMDALLELEQNRGTVAEIQARIRKKYGQAPARRTIYRVLKDMVSDRVARKEGRHFLYSPHDILRDRWLDTFDTIFKKLAPYGYDVDFIMSNHAFIITPDKMAVCAVECKEMKTAVDDLFSIVSPGDAVVYMQATGKIEKGQEVALVPRR